MNLSMEGNSGIFVELVPGEIQYEGPIDLAQYYIRDKAIGTDENNVAVKFTLGRRLLSTVLTTYVPTLLLNIIALSTNYFKVTFSFIFFSLLLTFFHLQDFFFEAVVTVNLTAMLVLATMFIGG